MNHGGLQAPPRLFLCQQNDTMDLMTPEGISTVTSSDTALKPPFRRFQDPSSRRRNPKWEDVGDLSWVAWQHMGGFSVPLVFILRIMGLSCPNSPLDGGQPEAGVLQG